MVPQAAVLVPSKHADALLRRLLASGLVDRSVRTAQREDVVLVPVRGRPPFDLSSFEAHLDEAEHLASRPPPRNPADAIRRRLRQEGVPDVAVPSGWERLGDVVVLQLPPAARGFEGTMGRAYAEILRARTVLEDRSGIHGPLRTPDMRVLWGHGTETVHVEGGVRFKLDVARVMFSSGNVAERTGGASGRVRSGEVVVDLFAGIGHFAIPLAMRTPGAIVHACELNPVAFHYLVENIRINRAGNVVAHRGDCRTVAPRGIADRVVMGHFDAPQFLDVAFECLRDEGTVLVHSLHPKEAVFDAPIAQVRRGAAVGGFDVRDVRARIVKSYAPGIVHVATEAVVTRRPKALSGPKVWGDR